MCMRCLAHRQPDAVASHFDDDSLLALEELTFADIENGPNPTDALADEALLELLNIVCNFDVLPEISRTTLQATKKAFTDGMSERMVVSVQGPNPNLHTSRVHRERGVSGFLFLVVFTRVRIVFGVSTVFQQRAHPTKPRREAENTMC